MKVSCQRLHRLIVSESSESAHSAVSQAPLKEPLGILFLSTFFFLIVTFGLDCLLPSPPVRPAVTDVGAGHPCSPPPFPRSGGDELLASTRRLCRSCAVLRCPVLKRIYLAAAGYRTGCPRRHEALRTKVRCPGGWFL